MKPQEKYCLYCNDKKLPLSGTPDCCDSIVIDLVSFMEIFELTETEARNLEQVNGNDFFIDETHEEYSSLEPQYQVHIVLGPEGIPEEGVRLRLKKPSKSNSAHATTSRLQQDHEEFPDPWQEPTDSPFLQETVDDGSCILPIEYSSGASAAPSRLLHAELGEGIAEHDNSTIKQETVASDSCILPALEADMGSEVKKYESQTHQNAWNFLALGIIPYFGLPTLLTVRKRTKTFKGNVRRRYKIDGQQNLYYVPDRKRKKNGRQKPMSIQQRMRATLGPRLIPELGVTLKVYSFSNTSLCFRYLFVWMIQVIEEDHKNHEDGENKAAARMRTTHMIRGFRKLFYKVTL